MARSKRLIVGRYFVDYSFCDVPGLAVVIMTFPVMFCSSLYDFLSPFVGTTLLFRMGLACTLALSWVGRRGVGGGLVGGVRFLSAGGSPVACVRDGQRTGSPLARDNGPAGSGVAAAT